MILISFHLLSTAQSRRRILWQRKFVVRLEIASCGVYVEKHFEKYISSSIFAVKPYKVYIYIYDRMKYVQQYFLTIAKL